MTIVRPRALVHRGVVEASGFWFDTRQTAPEETRKRILALWVPGAVVYRVADGLALCLPSPRTISTGLAPGVPLVQIGSLLAAAPLQPDEIKALAAPAGAMLLVRGGVATAYPLSPDQTEDPADWLAGEDFIALSVRSLGNTPPAPLLVAAPLGFDARARLEGVGPAAPELAQVLAALRGEIAASRTETSSAQPWWKQLLPSPNPGSAAASAPRWMQGLLRAAAALRSGAGQLGIGFGGFDGTGGGSGGGASLPSAGTSTGPLPLDALRRAAARLLFRAGLAGIVGRRQARYINRMMEMFERGELGEALRHAIPLDGAPSSLPSIPALGVPSARPDLRFTALTGGAGSSIGLGEDLFASLRTMYRQAFERLEREGRIEEAAFVLAELLYASEEAVAFLERHSRFQLAAEMAEGRALPPGLIVRQWFLAGNTDRAVLIARRTGAFADAVQRLDGSDKEKAAVLRSLWARALARAGDYAGAADVIWPVEDARQVALAWMDRAIESGGVSGARMLARRLALPASEGAEAAGVPEATRESALALLETEDEDQARERQVFTQTLVKGPALPVTVAVARAAARSMWRDVAAGQSVGSPAEFKKVVHFTQNGALRTDIPPLPEASRPVPLIGRGEVPLEITVAVDDTGTIRLQDAALLPGGQCLVALGESGLRLLSRDGRTVAHFDQPAHRLVLSDEGNHAIALAPRGDLWRLARLDLATRRATRWREAVIHAFPDSYDGSLWLVALPDSFAAIDATSEEFQTLWRTPEVPGNAVAVNRSSSRASLLLRSQGKSDLWGHPADAGYQWNRWSFTLPDLVLRDRGEISLSPAIPAVPDLVSPPPPLLSASGRIAESVAQDGAVLLHLHPTHGNERLGTASTTLQGEGPLSGTLSDTWAFAVTRVPGGVCGHLIHADSARLCARVTLAGAEQVSARLTTDTLVLADDRGRLLAVSLTDGRLLRNLRVTETA